MSKLRKRRREYRFIGFKVYADSDADILAWWEAIDEGQRSDTIRDLIRERLGLEVRRKRQPDLRELLQMRDDTAWIRSALNDMPVWLEGVLHQLAAMQPVVSGVVPSNVQPPVSSGLTSNDGERRARRMKGATW
jgi:hypothetical protein